MEALKAEPTFNTNTESKLKSLKEEPVVARCMWVYSLTKLSTQDLVSCPRSACYWIQIISASSVGP